MDNRTEARDFLASWAATLDKAEHTHTADYAPGAHAVRGAQGGAPSDR